VSDVIAEGVAVMVVDDQPPFRAAATSVANLISGWSVVAEVETGELAVESALAVHPDVVLMDINLPGISGLEATRLITDQLPGTRVILMSTYTPEQLPADAMECGALAYVRKEDLTPRVLRELLAG
jgi:two-component system invasion response regulator UvrY